MILDPHLGVLGNKGTPEAGGHVSVSRMPGATDGGLVYTSAPGREGGSNHEDFLKWSQVLVWGWEPTDYCFRDATFASGSPKVSF